MEAMRSEQFVDDGLVASNRVPFACRIACEMPSLIGTGLLVRGGFGVVV